MGSRREITPASTGWLTGTVAAQGGDATHPSAGQIRITLRRGARSFRGRWVKGRMEFTVPAECNLREMEQMIDRLVVKLAKRRPAVGFSLAEPIICPGLEIRFRENALISSGLVATPRLPVTYVEFRPGFQTEENAELLSRVIVRIAGAVAEKLLLPRAAEQAANVGARPSAWKIGRGHKVLGTCNSRGVITLSSLLVLLPQHLRDYIVWHELAHLREMNHSPRFHELCNTYCGGREAQLRRELRAFAWPILR